MSKKGKFQRAMSNNRTQNNDKAQEIYTNTKNIYTLDINDIISNPYQPRLELNNIEELKESISKLGLIQPVVVTKKDNKFVLVAGHRRLEAFKSLGKNEIEAIISEENSNDNLKLKALAENIQRENLTPLELAFIYKDIIDTNNINAQELSNIINKSKTHVSQILSILKLNDDILKAIKNDKYSTINVLNKLNQVEKDNQLEIYNNIKELNREEAIKYINDFLKNNKEKIVKEPFNIKENKGKYSINIDTTKLDENEAKKTVSELYKIIKKIKEDNKLN